MAEQGSKTTLSGKFDGPVAVSGGEAVDARGSKDMVYKPSGPVQIDRRIQFGLSPKTLLIGVLVVVLVMLGYWLARQPIKMTGDFNIIVAEFGEVTDAGVISSALARQLSRQLFDYLDSEYKNTDFGLRVQVAHHNIGMITEDREAERLARRLNADVVIYGSVFILENEARLTPRFYVAEHPDTSELTGQHRLGIPIDFALASLDFQDQVNREMQTRAAILVNFTEGMIHLSSRNPEAADAALRRAVQVAEKTGDFEGKEVLYLFISSAQQQLGDYEAANAALDEALSLNSEYARAYISRGNIYYAQAQSGSGLSIKNLEAALVEYEHAARAVDQSPGAYIGAKANVSRGNVYVILAQQEHDPVLFARALDFYQQVAAQYEETQDMGLQAVASIAHFGIGAAYERQGMPIEAREAYRRCLELTSDPELLARAKQQIRKLTSDLSSTLTPIILPSVLANLFTPTPMQTPIIPPASTPTPMQTPIIPPTLIPLPLFTPTPMQTPIITLATPPI